MTTAPHGNLRRRDFHPQVQQLASLRSLHRLRECFSGTVVRRLREYYGLI